MPDFVQTMADRIHAGRTTKAILPPALLTGRARLPATGWQAVLRGIRGRCPRCGEAKLFGRFLKPVLRCARCDQDWSLHSADDFPAYVSLLLTGHLMAPVIIGLTRSAGLSLLGLGLIILPMTLVLSIGLLQPAKGAIIALQWWLGMHGFEQERPDAVADDPKP